MTTRNKFLGGGSDGAIATITEGIRRRLLNEELERRRKVKVPEYREGTTIPVFYGRIRQREPMTLWWGDISTAPVPASAPETETIAHLYNVGLVLGLGAVGHFTANPESHPGEVGGARLLKIWAGEKLLRGSGNGNPDGYDDLDTNNANFAIGGVKDGNGEYYFSSEKYSGFFGVPGQGGSWGDGDWYFYSGSWEQGTNAYLSTAQALGSSATPYRGISYVVFAGNSSEGGFPWGELSILPDLSFEVEFLPRRLLAPSPNPTGAGDANPAEVLYDLLTNPWGRLGLTVDRVDAQSFRDAAATLGTEGNGVSFVLTDREPARAVIDRILFQIQGVIYEDPKTGRLTLQLIREDYVVADLEQLDETNCKIEAYHTSQWPETYNQVIATYNSREDDYTDATTMAQSMANWSEQGSKFKTHEIALPYCCEAGLANELASRELKTVSLPTISARLRVNRDAFEFHVGKAFKFAWTEASISDVVFRVQSINWGTLEDATITLDVIQDVFSLGDTVYADRVSPGLVNPLLDPTTPDDSDGFELPRWFQLQTELLDGSTDTDGTYVTVLAKAAASSPGTGFLMEITDPSATWGDGKGRYLHRLYTETADVETAYARTNEPYDTGTGLRIDGVTDTSLLVSATATEIANQGKNLIMARNAAGEYEILAFESVTTIGGGVYRLDNVWRGLLDTVPIDLSVNDRIWFLRSGSDLRASSVARFGYGTALSVGALASHGPIAQPVGQAAVTHSLTTSARALKPLPPVDVTLDGVKEWPGVAVAGEANNWIVTPDVLLDFKRRIRESATIIRGDAADQTPDDAGVYYQPAWILDTGSWGWGAPSESAAPLRTTISLVGAGSGYMRIGAARSSFSNKFGYPGALLQSETTAKINAQIAFYRQLLQNPSFDHSTDGQWWTETTGTPAYTDSASAYGFAGKYVSANADNVQLDQVIDVSALDPAGKDVRLVFYARNMNNSGATVQVQLISEKADGTDLDTADSGSLTPSTANWDRQELTISGLNSLTTQLHIIVNLTYSAGSGYEGAVDAFDLRLAPDISADQVTNGQFNADVASWTATNFAYSTSNNSEGAGVAAGGAAASGSMVQVITLPTGYAEGDIAHLRAIVYSTSGTDQSTLKLEARDGVPAVLETATTGAVAEAADGEWHEYNLYMKIPAGTADFKITFDATDDDVSGTMEVFLDDVSLYLYSRVGESAAIGTVAGTSTVTGVGGSLYTSTGEAAGVCKVEGIKSPFTE